MADPFVAEIRIYPFNFAPKGWAFCDGQIMPLSQNTALFSLLGTTYGGDGKTTFALPNLQGRAPMHQGQGPGLSDYVLGEMSGSDTVTLIASEMPAHSHGLQGVADTGFFKVPTNNFLASGASNFAGAPGATNTTMAFQSLAVAGGNLPHNNLQPYLTLNFCIALQGVFPPRT